MKKFVIPAMVLLIMSEYRITAKIQVLPGNLIFESAYAVSEPRTRHPKVAATEMIIVLKIYLEIGTHVLFMLENRSMKFCIVGLMT